MRYVGMTVVALMFGPLALVGIYSALRGHYWSPQASVSIVALVLSLVCCRLRAQILALALLTIALFGFASLSHSL